MKTGKRWPMKWRCFAFSPDCVNIHVTAFADETIQNGATKQLGKAPCSGLAHYELSRVLLTCNAQEATHNFAVGSCDDLCAELASQCEMTCQAHLIGLGQGTRQLDVGGNP